MADVFLIEPGVQRYEWGALSGIQELLGHEPDGGPVAEAWWGTHPAAPAHVDGIPLGEILARDAAAMLGPDVHARWGELPFMLKVLSIAKPLSIQVHPTKDQAHQILSRYDAEHSPLADTGHKPEMLVAVTDMRVQTGFRPLAQTAADLRAFGLPWAEDLAALLEAGDLAAYLHAVLDGPPAPHLLERLVALGGEGSGQGGQASAPLRAAAAASRAHPGDNGALVSLALNVLELEPGQACFTDAGVVHSYQSGLGLEIMATSDNVLRAGLTPKPVHVPLVLEVARLEAQEPDRPQPVRDGASLTYRTGAQEFELTFVTHGEHVSPGGPRIVLDVEGQVRLASAAQALTLERGQAAFVSHADARVTVAAHGQAVIASVPRPAASR